MTQISAVTNLADYRQQRQQTEQPENRMQDGFIAIPNDVEDALLRSPLTHRQERVYRAILRKTIGFGKTSDCIATSQIAEMTGLFVQHARKALADLIDMGMVVRGNRTKFGTNVSPVLASEKWDFSIANKRTKSVSLAVRTNQNGSDKRTESAPTIDNSTDNKPNTPYNPPAKKRAEAAKDKSEMPVTLTAASLIAEGVEEQTATDFIALRKAKRSPLTATALKGIKAEAAKAGYPLENAISECVTRGWQAFKADWVLRDARPVAQSATSKPSLDNDQPRNYGRSGKL